MKDPVLSENFCERPVLWRKFWNGSCFNKKILWRVPPPPNLKPRKVSECPSIKCPESKRKVSEIVCNCKGTLNFRRKKIAISRKLSATFLSEVKLHQQCNLKNSESNTNLIYNFSETALKAMLYYALQRNYYLPTPGYKSENASRHKINQFCFFSWSYYPSWARSV